MPIQFRCSGCGQPIEVDDEHAGKLAACPYCQRVVAVPQTSNFEPGPIPPARPGPPVEGGPPTPPPTTYWQPAPPSPRERTARRLGNYAWLCLVLTALLLVFIAFKGLSIWMQKIGPTSQMGEMTSSRFNEIQLEVMQELQRMPVVMAASLAAEALTVLALILAITSVVQSRRHNARGIVALVLSGLMVLCLCGGAVLTFSRAATT